MDELKTFSHVINNQPGMVDVSHKQPMWRTAQASAVVTMPEWLTRNLESGCFATQKGPVFHTAIIAATMAVKNTHQHIPFCHGLSIDGIGVDITVSSQSTVEILVSVKSFGKTGVEMEALTGASMAALTIYDMCKALTKDMEIREVKLLEKTKGSLDVSAAT